MSSDRDHTLSDKKKTALPDEKKTALPTADQWLVEPGKRPGTSGWFKRGRWEVERQRFGIDWHSPEKPFVEPASLQKSLRGVMKRLGLQSADLQSLLLEKWEQLVGPELAQRTRPGHIRQSELTIFVRGAIWYAQLKRLGVGTIQSRIVELVGADNIKRVVLQPDPEG